MKSKCVAFLILLAIIPCSNAETWGIPKVEDKQMTLRNTGPVALEVMINEVISIVGNKFDGTIRLVWADDAFSDSARLLRSALIRKGIAPERVLLTPRSGGYKNNAVTGVEVWIRQVVMRLPECEYTSQSYRYNQNDILGCAINNARNSSIINLDDYSF